MAPWGLSLSPNWGLFMSLGGDFSVALDNRRPHHALPVALRSQVVALARTIYAGCNDHHLTELLAEREGIQLSRSSLAFSAKQG